MKPIIAPIKPGESGGRVANLQEALFILLDRQIIRALDAPNRPTLEELQKLAHVINEERGQALFGEATYILILHFQIQQGLGDNLRGVVEDTTAARLNDILRSLGVLDDPDMFVVEGYVRYSGNDAKTAEGVPGVTVQAFDQDVTDSTPLGESVTDADGKYRITYTEEQFLDGDVGFAVPDALALTQA